MHAAFARQARTVSLLPSTPSTPPARPGRPLRQRLMLLLATGLLPVSLLGAWGVWTSVQGQLTDLERSTLELSRAIASTVESELDATLSTLEGLSHSPALAQGDMRAFYDIARREAQIRPNWAGLALNGHDGRLIFRTSAPYGADDQRTVDDASLQRALVAGVPVIGEVMPGPRGRAAFAVRRPVLVDGKVAYVLTAAVRPDRILHMLAKQQVPPGWVIGIFDSALNRVARTRDHVITKPSPTLRALLQHNPSPSGAGLTRSLEGEELYTGFTRLPGSRWTVAVGAPTGPVKAALLSSVGWYLLGALASVLASLLLARHILRQITHGTAAVRDQAVALGEGREQVPPPTGIAELDQMAQALQAAAQRLQQAGQDIRLALDQARAAGQAKDHFLAVLGHELRNPLSPMLTALHLMDLKAGDQLLRERQILRRQVDHMHRLVDDLLDISRVAQGKMELRLRALNLSALVERAIEATQPSVNQRAGQSIAVRLPAVPVWVHGDETRLVQAISNLLANALRFCPTGRVSVALALHEGVAELRVSDEGQGMSAETLSHVFEPFWQAPQPLERASGGLGLGLAIVRSIVELHGGSISAASDGPGRGAQFTIVLPTAAAPALQDQPALDAGAAGAGRVLLVDDKHDALETLAEVLRVAGYVVRAVAHPREAIELIDSFRPDVAILDIGLPEMDGYQLAQALRDSAPGWQGKLIALTGFGQHGDKQRAAAAGFERHITKPADPAALLNALAELVGGAVASR